MRINLTNNSPEDFIVQLSDLKQDFTVNLTNYTTNVEFAGDSYFFASEQNSPQLFSAYNRIKKDIDKSNNHLDFNPEPKVLYYLINSFLKNEKANFDVVHNIDIKSAYPKQLMNLGYITEDTFSFLEKIPKKDKLKAIGMIATQTIIYEFKKGVEISVKLKEDEEKRKVFFLLCHEIGNLMERISSEIGDDFLFFWFDGIYFKSESNKVEIQSILKESKFDFSYHKLTNFRTDFNKNLISISYEKKDETKVFSIPYKTKNRILRTIQKQKLK